MDSYPMISSLLLSNGITTVLAGIVLFYKYKETFLNKDK